MRPRATLTLQVFGLCRDLGFLFWCGFLPSICKSTRGLHRPVWQHPAMSRAWTQASL